MNVSTSRAVTKAIQELAQGSVTEYLLQPNPYMAKILRPRKRK